MNIHATTSPTFPAMTDRPNLLTARQAAACLAVSAKTLWNLTQAGDLACIRIGRSVRYDVVDLQRFVTSNKSAAKGT